MTGIQPKGENIRKAIKWISEMLQEDEGRSIGELIQQASGEFNLSPKEEGFLNDFYQDA
jgi:hypothetical protein